MPKADAGDNARGGVGNCTEEEAEKNKSVLLLELSAGDARAGVITPRPGGAGGGWVGPSSASGQSEMVLDVVDVERGGKGTVKEDIFFWDGAGGAARISVWRRWGEKYSGGSSTGVGWGCSVLGLAADDMGELDSGVFRIWCSTKFGGVVGIGRWSLGGDGTVVLVFILLLVADSDGCATEGRDDLKSVLNTLYSLT